MIDKDQIEDSAEALRALELQARESAQGIDEAFAAAGERLARSLGRAASDGKISMSELASAVLSAVNSAAGQSGSGSLGDVFSALFQQGYSGARAEGGPVLRGGAYLVGERGPEVFRPSVSGSVEAAGVVPQVQVNVTLSGGGREVVRSEAQIAAALQRAVRMGMR